MAEDALRDEAQRHLEALAGPSALLRDDQWAAIEALVVGRRRALVVQRTGWGKSAVYFIATALLRARGAGPTVIVSPLLALMRNQIEAAERAGIHAVTINSANLDEWQEVHAKIARGEADASALDAARERLRRPGVGIEPRERWPSGLSQEGLAGRIKAELSAEPGRALGRLTDLGWGNRLRALVGEHGEDGPVPDEVFAAIVKVLAAWGWAARPTAIVSLPSERRPQLIESLAARIGRVGRLPHLGALAYTRGSPGKQFNSAKRVLALRRTLVLPATLEAALAGASGPILLVDDRVDSGWTMTIAATLLRRAGAKAVLPLALATTS